MLEIVFLYSISNMANTPPVKNAVQFCDESSSINVLISQKTKRKYDAEIGGSHLKRNNL